MAKRMENLEIAMFPWFALGHITPFLHLSNKLAHKGHSVSFFVPANTLPKIRHFNRFPTLLTFVPITVPDVEGLPLGAETTSDVPPPLFSLIATAMDRTEPDVELLLRSLKPQIIFYDFAYWIPKLARRLGIKAVDFTVVRPATISYSVSPERRLGEVPVSGEEEICPPPGYPDPTIRLRLYQARKYVNLRRTFFGDILFYDRLFLSVSECDALAFKAYREMDGPFAAYLGRRFNKAVLLAGPVTPEPSVSTLEERWASWLDGFGPGSVVFCALGSEWSLEKAQFRELVQGLELSGFPFLAALKPPAGAETVEEALPEGFSGRVAGRGVVHGGWVQQQMILAHPSVGCFVTHCGSGSLSEALVNPCQIVMIPHEGDHIFQARGISNTLRAGVEVERDEVDGFFRGESVCKAIQMVMSEEDGSREIRANRAELRKLLQSKDLEDSYIDEFIEGLRSLVMA